MSIPALGVLGRSYESTNTEYTLVLQDSDPERGIGGHRRSGHGRFVLLHADQLVCQGRCERPTEGAVAENGTFALVDTLFADQIGSKLYLYSRDGDILYSRSFSANSYSVGVSAQGEVAAVQLCGSETDGSRLYVFDVNRGIVLGAFSPETGWPDHFDFCVPKSTVWLCYRKHGRRYRYSFDGELLDRERYRSEQIEDAGPTDLVWIVRGRLAESRDVEDLAKNLDLIERAFADDGLAGYDDWRAMAFRLKGEILEALERDWDAVLAFRSALRIDPKVGVKRRLKKLEKRLAMRLGSEGERGDGRSASGAGSSLAGEQVAEVLYRFIQSSFGDGRITERPLEPSGLPEVLTLLRRGDLDGRDVLSEAEPVRRLLYELLTQYVMFLTMNPTLPFPEEFLVGSSGSILGAQVTEYMAQNGLPFPQLLTP